MECAADLRRVPDRGPSSPFLSRHHQQPCPGWLAAYTLLIQPGQLLEVALPCSAFGAPFDRYHSTQGSSTLPSNRGQSAFGTRRQHFDRFRTPLVIAM